MKSTDNFTQGEIDMSIHKLFIAVALFCAVGASAEEQRPWPAQQIAGACEDQCYNTQKTCMKGCSSANAKPCVDGCLRGSDACRKRCSAKGLMQTDGWLAACTQSASSCDADLPAPAATESSTSIR